MADLDKILASVQKAGQIAAATNGVVGIGAGLVTAVIGIVRDLRNPEEVVKLSPEEIAARLEKAVEDYGIGVDELQAANDAYFQIPAKPVDAPSV